MHFYHDLVILALSIFLSCMLLLIHIFIYVPIIRVFVLSLMLCHLLLISIVLIIYASCVPSMFHLIPFGMSIIYSYHIHVSWLLHIALHILIKYDVYEITPYSYILIPL